MTIPRILYDNRSRDPGRVLQYSGSVVPGFEPENAFDWKDFTSFRASNLTNFDTVLDADGDVDCFCWYVHEPIDRLIIDCQWEDGFNNFVTLAVAAIGTGFPDPLIGMKTFPKVTIPAGRKLRYTFSALSVQEDVRQLAAGVRLDSPIGQHQGIRPPNLAGEFIQSNVESVGGSFIGRDKIRQQISSEIELEFLDPQIFVRDLWVPLLEHAERYAFFYAWDLDGHPQEIVYAWSRGNPRPLNTGPAGKMSVSLPIGALAK
jgi:hypothetical protein